MREKRRVIVEAELIDHLVIIKLGVGRRAMPFDLGHLSFRSREVRFGDLNT